MTLLTGLARTNNRRLFLFTALGYVRAKLVVYQEDYCGDLVHLEDTLSGVLPFHNPPASEGSITVMIVLYTCNT